MKHALALFGTTGLAVMLFTTSVYSQTSGDPKETPKPRHIKLLKIENGKKMELDTMVTGKDVFIWNGDTIGGEELGKHINPSGFDKMEHKKMVIRKMIKDGDEEQMIYLNCPDMKNFPPMPPMPPHMKMWKGQHAGRVIDLNDPNIISYKKKDMKGGREKIEIIRNKPEEPEDMSFDFQVDDQLLSPPPPPLDPNAPEQIREFNDGNEKIKIIEKASKVDGKDGKEIKVEVESKDTK